MKSNQVFKAEKFRIYSKFKHSSWRWEEDNTITICRLSNNFNSEIFKLNQPAAILYYYCNGKHTLDELIKKLEKVMVKFNFKLFNHFIKILIKKKLIILGKSKFDINPVGGNIKINKINKQNFKIIDFFKEFNKHKGKGKLLRFKKPVRALFTLNFSCNLKCRGCVQNSFDSNQDFRKISISKKKAIKIIDKLINEKFLFISFMGGEIFVRNDIFDIIKYCKEHGMLVMAITNATLLNKKNISQLAKIGLDGFNIGFDSMKSDINNYSKDSTLFQKMLKYILII
ncbi:radical SAM protein, partial [Candidatus Woesearchaeota archaeon]|nr:radical SAM protein [Candidatus Woesearchaeota archaeon]